MVNSPKSSSREDVIAWLMEGDASIRWQVMRDLLKAPRAKWEAQREKVAKEGWGKRLIELQDKDGKWGGGLYTPKWTSTTYTLLQLREMGLPQNNGAAARGCRLMLDRMARWEDTSGGRRCVSYCTCVAGMVLALSSYFQLKDRKLAALVEFVLDQQMADGGWNCRNDPRRTRKRTPGATHSSFHTTFNVLDGVREAMTRGVGNASGLRKAESRAMEFMLMHRMYKSDRTGRVIKEAFTRLSFPPRWHYDVLRGLDYMRTTKWIKDDRLSDVFELLESKRNADGTWAVENEHRGLVHFRMEGGRRSRWNTLRVMRCLDARVS